VTTASPNSSVGGKATHITEGVKFKGEITGRAEIVIDGEVEGRIDVQAAVIVGANGQVDGDIFAKSVAVGGKVNGNVKAGETFELQASGRIEGDVTAPRVIIAEGAFFKGNVEMTGGQ
jgi:cytoskeletal protein CcmA (bactofilin family)